MQSLYSLDRSKTINVIGHISAAMGLGVSARNLVKGIIDRGCSVSLLDLDPGGGRHGHDRQFESLTVDGPEKLPGSLNLWVIPPHSIGNYAREMPVLFESKYFNAAFPMWELPRIPDADRLILEVLDAAVCATDFIRYSIDFSVSGVRTVSAKHPFALPEGIVPDRVRFGLPSDAVVFIFSFEPLSCMARKNPFAVIDAFLNSVAHEPNAHLVIKVNNATIKGRELPSVVELRDRIGNHPHISLISEPLSYADALSLFASADVFVSLHRAEGFGLGMLEAMLLGKPVIATAWSGNMSFMKDTNSCLVGYTLIPTNGTVAQYKRPYIPKGTVWADPSVSEAAEWMSALFTDKSLRQHKGEAARRDAEGYCADAMDCAFIDEIFAIADHSNPNHINFRRRDLSQRLRRIKQLTQPTRASDIVNRVGQNLRALLDRHILWRLNPENRTKS